MSEPLDRTVDHGSADPLDAGMAAAFGPDSGPPLAAGNSVLRALGAMLPDVPQVQLRDPDSGAHAPIVRPHSPEMPEGRDSADRLQLHGEIARGGMGAVLRGRDVDLGREIAVKVLLESHAGRTELVQRFVEEAQIAGQLQHPGIVPVYEFGQLRDRRPYFTMKLVRGQTLAKQLAERAEPGQERGRFVGVFLQVCQALAYAHAHGVIHRDLKPSNVMVGAYGEVQVLDWGLAKVLKEGGVADEKKARQQAEDLTAIRTRRSEGSDAPGSAGTQTQAGSVLGTPAYMPPEQALGEVDRLDERADVFGLGAILCEILTGKPPYVGETFDQVHRKAIRADLADAFARLDGCGADADLVGLCKRCLAAELQPRPRNAGELAGELSAYLQGVEARLRQAELAHAAAQARAEEEQKRRKLTLALAGSVLLIVLLGGGGWMWIAQQQAGHERESLAREVEATRQIHDALAQANALREQARLANDDPGKWAEARAMAKRAEALLETGPANPELVGQVRALVGELDNEENDRRLLARLDQIQLAKTEVDVRASGFAEKRALPEYARAFAEHGLKVPELFVEEAVRRVRQRPQGVCVAVVAALDDWLDLARRFQAPEADWLARVVDGADDDPWRKEWRAAVARQDDAALKRLADAKEAGRQPPQTVLLLARYLAARSPGRAAELLRAAQPRYPADFWINYSLASADYNRANLAQADSAAFEGAIRYSTAALALRPDNPRVLVLLGYSLSAGSQQDQAHTAILRSLELAPGLPRAHLALAHVFTRKGRFEEAAAACRQCIALAPEESWPHNTLALLDRLDEQKFDEALVGFRRALALSRADPQNEVICLSTLASMLIEKGRRNEAAAVSRRAVALGVESDRRPGLLLLGASGQADAAIALCRKAIAAKPEDSQAQVSLGCWLAVQGRFKEAQAAMRRGHELRVKHPSMAYLPTQRWLRDVERWQEQDRQLAAYAAGMRKPKGRGEVRNLAFVCVVRQRPLLAARMHADALTADPAWAADPLAEALYDAARFAALAAGGRGEDAAGLAETERARWRRQSRQWLEAELARTAKHLARATPLDRGIVLGRLRWWQQEPDLAGLRDDEALKALPEEERQACKRLWADVAALQAKTAGK